MWIALPLAKLSTNCPFVMDMVRLLGCRPRRRKAVAAQSTPIGRSAPEGLLALVGIEGSMPVIELPISFFHSKIHIRVITACRTAARSSSSSEFHSWVFAEWGCRRPPQWTRK